MTQKNFSPNDKKKEQDFRKSFIYQQNDLNKIVLELYYALA